MNKCINFRPEVQVTPMTIEDLMSISKRLKGTSTDIKWEHHLCFSVGEKMYLLTSPDEVPPSACFKVTGEDFDHLTEREGIDQARYFAKRQWVLVKDISHLNREEWEHYISHSYELVSAKLTKKKRSELGLEQ